MSTSVDNNNIIIHSHSWVKEEQMTSSYTLSTFVIIEKRSLCQSGNDARIIKASLSLVQAGDTLAHRETGFQHQKKEPYFRLGCILVIKTARPGQLSPVSHLILTLRPPHLFIPSFLPPTGKHLINSGLPLWDIHLTDWLFQGPLEKHNNHSKRVLSPKQKSKWKANSKNLSTH